MLAPRPRVLVRSRATIRGPLTGSKGDVVKISHTFLSAPGDPQRETAVKWVFSPGEGFRENRERGGQNRRKNMDTQDNQTQAQAMAAQGGITMKQLLEAG